MGLSSGHYAILKGTLLRLLAVVFNPFVIAVSLELLTTYNLNGSNIGMRAVT